MDTLLPFIPLVLLAVVFAAYCVRDVLRRESTRFLPRWLWAILCCISLPLGGIAYLLFGRDQRAAA